MTPVREADLRERLRLLEEDNRALAERAEDITLLGLISEGLGTLDARDAVLDHVLERICILKDLPRSGVARRRGESLVGECSYALDRAATPPPGADLPAALVAPRPGAPRWLDLDGDPWTEPGGAPAFRPLGALLVPLPTRAVPEGVLWVASDRHTGGELEHLAPLLQRVVHLAGTHLDLRDTLGQLRGLNAELDTRVAERTGELEEANRSLRREIEARRREEARRLDLEAQLAQRQKLEALGTLAGGIAHDFNNILAAILGFTELAQLDPGDGRQVAESLSQVQGAATRAAALVQQILTFSRRAEVARRDLDAAAAVFEGLELLRASLPQTVTLEVEVDPASGTVEADPTQLEQVLVNLVTNAAHAVEGRGTVRVELGPRTLDPQEPGLSHPLAAGPYVRLAVTDDGVGMDPATVGRIYEPFFTTKATGQGTGLGLAIVHGVVGGHGGAVRVRSCRGEGSCFEVWLPRRRTPEAQASRGAPAAAGVAPGLRVMLVDDEEALLAVGVKLLEALGCACRGFPAGAPALEAFRADPAAWDLLITDQIMPGMTGLELARAARALCPGLPLLLCSGYTSEVGEEALASLEPARFLAKPYSLGELSGALEGLSAA